MRHALVTAVCASLACAASARVESQSPNLPAEGDAHRDNVRKIAESLKPGDRADPDPLIPNGWRPTKTVWGDPDIEGVYTNIDE